VDNKRDELKLMPVIQDSQSLALGLALAGAPKLPDFLGNAGAAGVQHSTDKDRK
jgi:hypothetical protein